MASTDYKKIFYLVTSPKPKNMKGLGSFLIVLGLAAIIMNFFGYVPTLLSKIYDNGPGTAWAIKIGLVVVGIILYWAGSRRTKSTSNTA